MAVVYRAVDTVLDRVVAIKVMHPHLATREESRLRFSREARAVARLRHPSIVEIYDFSGDEARESYIVTEFVRGRTLRAFGDEVGFPIPELAVLVAAQLAEALAHAHAAGIVHRDLKPENVMVREDGVLKLMDFGIARLLGGDERMTMTGALVGSPLHMAPEIIEGREAGEAADVFALGTILYWMVTGEMAFAGNNTTQTLRRILEGDYQDPRIAAPACSDELAGLIGRCLAKDPADRPASMSSLREELTALLAPLGIERIDEELQAFFRDPEGYAADLRPKLVAHLVEEGERALHEKRSARALSLFNRILALDPSNERVRAQLERMGRRRQLVRRLRRIGFAAAALLILGGGALGARALWPPQPENGAPLASGGPAGSGAELGQEGPAGAATGGPVASGEAQQAAAPPEGESRPAGPEGAGAGPRPEAVGDRSAAVEGSEGATGDAGQPAGAGSAPTREAGPLVASRTGAATAPAPVGDPRQSAPQPTGSREPPAMQQVSLRWVPQGATLYIDGERIDTVAPAWNGSLPVGPHTFVLSHPDCCQPWEETIELTEATPLRRSIALAPQENGWFEVACSEPDAEVWFEGTFRGTVAEVNARGGVPVAFSRDDTGRFRYVKNVRFQVLPPRGRTDLAAATGEVAVRAGQRSRSPEIRLEARRP